MDWYCRFMNIIGKLELDYSALNEKQTREIMSFLDELPLTIEDCGFPGSPKLCLHNVPNNVVVRLTPIDKRVHIEGSEMLAKRKYRTSFCPIDCTEKNCVSEFYVGLKKPPYTGIYFRTGPKHSQ